MTIELDKFNENYLKDIWKVGYSQDMPEWAKWNGPYFEEYTCYKDEKSFSQSEDWKFLLKDNCRAILIDKKAVGMVSRNWHDRKTRWMEIGIVIYDESFWSKGYGKEAFKIWISQSFKDYPELEHLGLTTWSGNKRMMGLAEKLGFLKEAQIRKVRYWQGFYYDSIKYGVLREEWFK